MTTFAAKTTEHDSAKSKGAKSQSDNLPDVQSAPLFGFPIQRKAACACGGDCPNCQSKHSNLPISQPNDASEIEADRVAEKVMRMPEDKRISPKYSQSPTKSLSETIAPIVQPKGENYSTVSSETSNKIVSSQGKGNSLDRNTQSFMQNRFDADFSEVKIHSDKESVQLNNELNAKAFTVGNDIYFNEGQYQPHSESGRHLLAHELTHTIQQQPKIGRKIIQRLPKEVSSPDDCGKEFIPTGTGIINNKSEGGEIPYNMGGIPTKDDPKGNPLKVSGKIIKLADGDEIQVGQIGYKFWRAVCLKVSDRKKPEIFWVRASYISEKKKEKKTVEKEKGVFEELASTTTTASAKPEYLPHATKELNRMGKMASDIKSFADVKATGKKIRATPDPKADEITRIKYNELIMVRASNTTGDWLYISAMDGRQGWTQKDFVAENIPDQNATIYHTPNRESLEPILAEHYRKTDPYSIKTGDDLRILAMAVYIANKDDGRVSLDKSKFETDLATDFKDLVDPWNEENRKVYRSIKVTSANIWLPGTKYVNQLKAQGLITTRPDWMNVLIDTGKAIIGFNAGMIAGFFGGIWDMLTGLYDLAKNIISLVGKVFSGAILDDLQSLYEAVEGFLKDVAADPEKKLKEIITAVSDAIWGAAKDFYNKWTATNTWDKWFFRGEIVGMICLEVVMFLLSGGAANAAKWIAKLSKIAPKLVKFFEFLQRLVKGIDDVTPDVLKKKHKRKGGDSDIEPDNDRNREKLTALALAKGITEANDIKDTEVIVLMGFLKPLSLKYKVKFDYKSKGGNAYQIGMTGSERKIVDEDYTEKPGTKLPESTPEPNKTPEPVKVKGYDGPWPPEAPTGKKPKPNEPGGFEYRYKRYVYQSWEKGIAKEKLLSPDQYKSTYFDTVLKGGRPGRPGGASQKATRQHLVDNEGFTNTESTKLGDRLEDGKKVDNMVDMVRTNSKGGKDYVEVDEILDNGIPKKPLRDKMKTELAALKENDTLIYIDKEDPSLRITYNYGDSPSVIDTRKATKIISDDDD